MASPFSVFRENQKIMMATLGLAAIIAFVFLPMIMQGTNRGPVDTGSEIMVKTTAFGDLSRRDLAILVQEHSALLGVMEKLLGMVYNQDPAAVRASVERSFGPANETSVFDNWFFAKEAERRGFQVSDATVNGILEGTLQKKLQGSDIEQVVRGYGLTMRQFFNIFQRLVLSGQYRRMIEASTGGTSPAQHWDYFTRVKKQATIECIPVAVENFTSQVANPSKSDLEAFFDKYKDQLPSTSNTPGFRLPKKVSVEYFKIALEKYLDPAKVTDEQIDEEYNKDLEKYDRSNKTELEIDAKKEGEKKTDKPTDEKKPADAKPSEAKPAEEKKPSDAAPAAKEEKKTSGVSSAPVHQVAYIADDVKTSAATAAVGSAAAPAVEKAVTAAGSAVTAAGSATTTALGSASVTATGSSAKSLPGDSTTPVKKSARDLHPRVKKIIRDAVAREVAFKKIAEDAKALKAVMDENGAEWLAYDAEKIRNKDAVAPKKLDMKALADKYGFKFTDTGMLSASQMTDLDIHTSYVDGNGNYPFVAMAYQALPRYSVRFSQGADGDTFFLFWKTAESKERTPKFAEEGVQETVLKAWKLVQARTLAEKEAQRLADEAKKSGDSLKKTFGGDDKLKVLAPAPFSWLTSGSLPLGSERESLRLSTVEGVDLPGETFMKTVFSLEDGQVGVARNQPETVYYVVRLTKTEPAAPALWDMFSTDDVSKYADAEMYERQRAADATIKGLRDAAGVTFVHPLDARNENSPTE